MGIGSKVKAVFLDRDGILNNSIIVDGIPYPPKSLDDLIIPEGVNEGLKQLSQHGYVLIIITNQPDVARGKTKIEVVNSINNHLQKKLLIDDVFCCIHDDSDNCNCRKPKPGMIMDAIKKWNIDIASSYMVGDRWKDIETGKNAGLKTILINCGYNEKYVEPDYSCINFNEVTQIILSNN